MKVDCRLILSTNLHVGPPVAQSTSHQNGGTLFVPQDSTTILATFLNALILNNNGSVGDASTSSSTSAFNIIIALNNSNVGLSGQTIVPP